MNLGVLDSVCGVQTLPESSVALLAGPVEYTNPFPILCYWKAISTLAQTVLSQMETKQLQNTPDSYKHPEKRDFIP